MFVCMAVAAMIPPSATAADGGAPGPSSADPQAQWLQRERRACEAGELTACLSAARYDQPKAERLGLLEKACLLGPRGCVDLAFGLAGGHPEVPLDLDRAKTVAGRVCDDPTNSHEVGGACLVLAQITPNRHEAHDLLLRACRLGWNGYRGEIYTNYWLPPGRPPFRTNCNEPVRLGQPLKRPSATSTSRSPGAVGR